MGQNDMIKGNIAELFLMAIEKLDLGARYFECTSEYDMQFREVEHEDCHRLIVDGWSITADVPWQGEYVEITIWPPSADSRD